MNWDHIAEEVLAVAHEVLSDLQEDIRAASTDMVARIRAGHKILFCGNGGSAADAQHFAAELVNRFLLNRDPLPGMSLTTDTSAITSIGNDFGFDQIFARQVRGLGRPGDLLVGLSTSGNSPNVVKAVEVARELGLGTLALVGGEGGILAARADRVLRIACTGHTPRIQEGHHLIMHLICEDVEAQLAGSDNE
jgi:D-sedoheptulose 7-phosphate isomerase